MRDPDPLEGPFLNTVMSYFHTTESEDGEGCREEREREGSTVRTIEASPRTFRSQDFLHVSRSGPQELTTS